MGSLPPDEVYKGFYRNTSPSEIKTANNQDTQKILYVIIIVLLLILAVGGISFFMYVRNDDAEQLNSAVETTQQIIMSQTEQPATTVTAAETTKIPEIICEVKIETSSEFDMSEYILYTSGNYDYYKIECYEYHTDTPKKEYLVVSETTSQSMLHLTSGFDLDHVTVSVTPYFDDGTAGETVSYTAEQPEYLKYSEYQAENRKVYPCDETAVINGNGASGFTTDYIVYSGAEEMVRERLANGLHVVSSRYCQAFGLTWYELNDKNTGEYYGWVDSSYLAFYSEDEKVVVYSCQGTGEINSKGVSGFTTSYVVDGGAKTTVRETLGEGQHVTATSYCYAYGLTWYELYDTDDGDYYGWVDENFIDFYAFYDGS